MLFVKINYYLPVIFFLIEIKKLEKHLALLREEYVKIQTRMIEYERKYETLAASVGDANLSDKSFVNRLLKKVADLFEKDLYR